MINNRSYYDNNTSPDNTFNFGNELDISNGKKDKTGEMFFKQAYDFDDFQNIGDDKTVKSSNYKTRKDNMSNIIKRQQDNSSKMIGNSVLGEFQLSGTGFHTKKVLDESINKALSQTQKFPQFGQRKFSVESNKKYAQYSNSKQASAQGIKINMRGSQLSYSKSNLEAQDPPTLQNTISKMGFGQQQEDIRVKYEDYPQSFRKKEVPDFRKKEMSNFKQEHLLTKEQEYKQLISKVKFYKSEAERINYERTVMEQESIGEMVNLCNSQGLEQQLKNHLQEINQLNREIEQQRAAQKKLTRVIAQLQEEYNQIIDSVEEMDFQRPPIIKDEAKVLMDEINQLKKQFRDLQIDNGELNLSCTIPHMGTLQSIENRMGQSHHPKEATSFQDQQVQNYLNSLFEEIHEENSISQDPQFLKNLKLACLKDQWTIFTNKQIIVSLDYKTCPLIKMRIGNKTNQQLEKFTMQIQVQNIIVNYMQNQTINKKAFLLQGIKVDPQNLADLFIKINLSYQISSPTPETKSIKLYCPTGIFNFGEFTPLTIKQFETQMNLPLPILESSLKPIDKSFINSIQQILFYIPNLKPRPGQNDKLFGLFMSVFNEGTLVLIEENLDLIKIKLKNGSKPLLKLLQFILTV